MAKFTEEELGIFVEFPDLDGCVSFGEDFEEALVMAKDSLNYFLTNDINPNDPLPFARHYTGGKHHWITPDINISIALYIRKVRMEAGLTQTELAKRIGFSVQQLQNLELPHRSNPTVKTLSKLSKALGSELKITI